MYLRRVSDVYSDRELCIVLYTDMVLTVNGAEFKLDPKLSNIDTRRPGWDLLVFVSARGGSYIELWRKPDGHYKFTRAKVHGTRNWKFSHYAKLIGQ